MKDKPTVFVFGSNLAGIHGAGSALEARKNWGALQRIGVGRQGMSYAIPTKDEELRVLSLSTIRDHVRVFINYANNHPDIRFKIVFIGCGLAGYTPQVIAPLFKDAPSNCWFTKEFEEVLKYYER